MHGGGVGGRADRTDLESSNSGMEVQAGPCEKICHAYLAPALSRGVPSALPRSLYTCVQEKLRY